MSCATQSGFRIRVRRRLGRVVRRLRLEPFVQPIRINLRGPVRLHALEEELIRVRAKFSAARSALDEVTIERDQAWLALDEATIERDEARALQSTQARIWSEMPAASNEDPGGFGGVLDSLRSHGEFSYRQFEMRREELLHESNPYVLGEKTRSRLSNVIGPIGFSTAGPTLPPPPTVAFACVCTDKFIPGLEALLGSLHEVYPDLDNDFWVFHDDGLSDLNRARLEVLHPRIRVASRSTQPYLAVADGDSPNQRRIGATGYLNIEALRLGDYERVVILDSDLLVTGDISELWLDPRGDDLRVVADAGVIPMTTGSSATGAAIFNSGVISLPSQLLGDEGYEAAIAPLDELMRTDCEGLREFADQRFWNLFAAGYDHVTFLSGSLNVNKQLVERYVPSRLGETRILHFTGFKPWFDFIDVELLAPGDRSEAKSARSRFPTTFALWDASYRRSVGPARRAAFREIMGSRLDSLRDVAQGGRTVLIGNGPSLSECDLTVFEGDTKVAFNWFVNHPAFDEAAVDHLMVMSHMFFGGWHVAEPAFPLGFLDGLTKWSHRPTLWFPFYFEPLVSKTPELADFDICYLLLEKPFKRFAEDVGALRLDLTDFLVDAHTGVLTAGFPLACWLGSERITLVGCDANYGQTESDYFYANEEHTSPSTRTSSLHSAWAADGVAHYCYELASRAAAAQGVMFEDATIDGMLTVVPKAVVPGLRIRE